MNTSPFVSSAVPLSSDRQQRLEDQLNRFQQRHLDMVREAAEELNALRQELASSNATDQTALLEEVGTLQAEVATLREQNEADRQAMQEVLDSVKTNVNGQLRGVYNQLKSLSLEALNGIEQALDSVEQAELPTLRERTPLPVPVSIPVSAPIPAPAPAPAPVAHSIPITVIKSAPPLVRPAATPVSAQKLDLPKKERPAKPKKSRHLLRRFSFATVMAALIVGAVYALPHLKMPQKGTVAGVSTDPSITNPAPSPTNSAVSQFADDDYKESKVVLPFAQTQWDTLKAADFGLNVDYPKNTTDVVHTIGGENIFFLRFNSYMFKITRIELDDGQTFDQWFPGAQTDYSDSYTFAQGSFNNRPAWVATPTTQTDTSGTIYFISRPAAKGSTDPNAAFEIWVKNEPAGSDDELRLERMVSSFQFTT